MVSEVTRYQSQRSPPPLAPTTYRAQEIQRLRFGSDKQRSAGSLECQMNDSLSKKEWYKSAADKRQIVSTNVRVQTISDLSRYAALRWIGT